MLKMYRTREYPSLYNIFSWTSASLESLFVIFLITTNTTCIQGLKFIVEPSDVVVTEGYSVTLPCSGYTPSDNKKESKIAPNIRWRGPDGQDIGIDLFRAQLPNGSLYISSVEENRGLTGAYQCLLSADGIGTIVSRSARVSIAKLPEINHLFSEIYLYPGQTAYFKCLTNPMANEISYQIQWLKDDAPLRIDDTRMLLLPSGAIEIDEITLMDRGTYQCNVTAGAISRLSSKSSLNIKTNGDPQSFQTPVFLTESAMQTVREGDTVTVDCVSNGNPRPLIKWLRNGEDIDINDLDSRFRIIGTGSLQISSVDDTDSGNYQCRASNSVDSQDMQASLQVQVPPKFIESPTDKMAMEKEELEFVCSIRGKPTPIIQWLKNGDVITPNDYMQIVAGHNLQIHGLINSDAGMFQCIGSNPAGSIQAAARLQIGKLDKNGKRRRQFTTKIKSLSDTPHQPLPTSTINEQKNTKIISKNVFESLRSQDKDKHLPLHINDNDDYDDYDDDDDGDDDNAGGSDLLGNNNNDNNDDDDDDDEDDEGSIHKMEPGVDPTKFLNSLTNRRNDEISHFSQSPFPTVTRKYPPDVDNGNSTKTLLPGPPRDLVAQIVNPRFVALSWMEPLINPDEVISYIVYYKMSTSERERKIITKSRDDQLANIQSLLPGKTYQFRVVGNSNHGPGESSKIYEVSTQPEENIAGPPQNVKGYSISEREIFVHWNAPLVTNGNITQYRIYYAENEGPEMYADSTLLSVKLTDLRPYTEYTVTVVPFNQNGMGDPSNEFVVKTFSSVPAQPPINVTLETTSSTSITIRWEPPAEEDQNGQITGYKIRYRKHKKAYQVESTSANVRHFELKNLEKMAQYQVKIAAMTVNGTGPFTEWNHIETYENDLTETQVPGEPAFMRTRASAESILVSWGQPSEQDIKVRGYVLSWGLGVPDIYTHVLEENSRYYEITGLEQNNEYVISLRARNLMGDGPPRYDYIRTRDDDPIETPAALEVPVGLRAVTMSSSSIVVYWTDTTLNRNQQVIDNRQYVVRYNSIGSNRFKYFNTTKLNCMISELRSNTQYEFAVKVVKGRRESAWSMSVLNSTEQASPISPPRDLSVRIDDTNSQNVILSWQPPRNSGIVPINGYVVFYTTDTTKGDRDWYVEAVVGDTHRAIIRNLLPYSTYYFKVQTRSVKGQLGPFSAMISHTTGNTIAVQEIKSNGGFTNQMMVYLIVGIAAVTLLIALAVVIILCRRKPPVSPEHTKQSYHKNNAGIKPPDLWIHHDQMELKNVDKNQHNQNSGQTAYSDGASSSGALTLPRSVGHEYDGDNPNSHNSLDKHSYVPGYMTTSMNSTMERPNYPRTQYNINMNSRAHVSVDPTLSQQNLLQSQGVSLAQTPDLPYGYDSMPTNYSNPSVTYAPGLSVDAPKRGQGHPLKSFSVPGPPSSTPVIPSSTKHNVPAVTIRPQNASPYKKPTIPTNTTNRLQTGPTVAHSNDEIQRLAPSTSTEELNQEMANLEGLMKDLSAITANEFEC